MKLIDFFKSSIKTTWEGFLKNAVVLLTAFILSGGYLVAINKIKDFQVWVRGIPTDYVLTPLVLLLVAIVVLVRINKKQKEELSKLQQEPIKDESDARFVTHLGVWWKIYTESEYIEDFPYCSCCERKLKLIQIEWHPAEVYKCPKTCTEYKLFDKVPRRKGEILQSLYSSYFRRINRQFEERFNSELHRLRELDPDIKDIDLCKKLFEIGPLAKIPEKEKQQIFLKNENPIAAYHFVEKYLLHYQPYFKLWKQEQIDEKT